MSTVIVFGPTGKVASVAAATAQEHGATVWLAMRDPQKSIPGLTSRHEQGSGFKRVQADLTKPDTVSAAVKASGAKRAFIYVAIGSPGHMRSTVTALKSAGIEFVVLLSSYTISGELRGVPPSDLIAYSHAQVEINLDEVFGSENYVAVRPGGFATNMLRFKDGINAGEVKIFGSSFQLDGITPTDMGRVIGTILVQGPKNGQHKVYLYGPQVMSQGDAIQTVGKVLGKDVKLTDISQQEGLDQFLQNGVPKPFADYMIRVLAAAAEEQKSRTDYETGVENVRLYTGKPSMRFQEWVELNKDLFSS
jgi:nucleoside-diphosphate-sugar epimerase